MIYFANYYCWNTPNNYDVKEFCRPDDVLINTTSIESSNNLKILVRYLPFFLILQAISFTLPWMVWHSRIETPLRGHLKFMQYLLIDISKQLEEIEETCYKDECYDESSSCFNRHSIYKNEDISKEKVSLDKVEQEYLHEPGNEVHCKNEFISLGTRLLGFLKKIIYGDITDRHFFSMMCYENFVRLHQTPYILSVFKLCKDESKLRFKRDVGLQLNENLLYQWCHTENFNDFFIVKAYILKHIIMVIFGAVFFTIMAGFGFLLILEMKSTNNFSCYLALQQVCMTCIMQHERNSLAVFGFNLVIVATMLLTSFSRWRSVRKASRLSESHFLDKFVEAPHNAFVLAARKSKKD
ncbi:unnamed protein product [Clavelina lepadiformis]|uniref:Uncharacterized protein n=1 Tax=Clavelina lepadiformis TaxID=159417 RepID=A0ABP0GQY2_CLALP